MESFSELYRRALDICLLPDCNCEAQCVLVIMHSSVWPKSLIGFPSVGSKRKARPTINQNHITRCLGVVGGSATGNPRRKSLHR